MRILCYGDSNTFGCDPRSYFADRYDRENRWTDLLAAYTHWEVINEGCNGRQVPRDCRDLSLLAEHAPVDLMLIMLGTNDLLQGRSAEDTARQMARFLDALIPHCQVLLVAPPAMARGAWVPSEDLIAESLRLAEEYARLAHSRGIPFVSAAHWSIPLAFDGVHFTEDGHHRFARCLKEAFEKIFFPLDSHPA